MCGENDNTLSFTHPNCLDLMDPRSTRSCGVMSPGPGQGAGWWVTSVTAASSLDAGCRWVWLRVQRPRMLVFQETSRLFHCQPDMLRFTHAVSKIFSLKRSCKIGKRALASPVVLRPSSQHAGSFARAAHGTALRLHGASHALLPSCRNRLSEGFPHCTPSHARLRGLREPPSTSRVLSCKIPGFAANGI